MRIKPVTFCLVIVKVKLHCRRIVNNICFRLSCLLCEKLSQEEKHEKNEMVKKKEIESY